MLKVIYDNANASLLDDRTEYTTNQNEGNHSSSGKFTIGGNQTHSPIFILLEIKLMTVAVWNDILYQLLTKISVDTTLIKDLTHHQTTGVHIFNKIWYLF